MAFDIYLYTYTGDPKQVFKTPTQIGNTAISCRPTEDCDVLNPTFILDYKEEYLAANYCYCSLFNKRYYFINDMSVDIGKKIILHCSVDVLNTYSVGIEEGYGCITRASELEGHPWGITYVGDSKFPMTNRRNVETYSFGTSPFVGSSQKILWETYNGIPSQPISIVLNIGDYFYWQKWKYELTGTADSAFAQYVGESLPGPSDTQVHNGTLITIGTYRYKVRVANDYSTLYISHYN